MDSGNFRVVRIDDLTGANWIAYGSPGAGSGQFAAYLTSLAVDSAARIYVADTGNKRIVRIDDMTGANWTALTQGLQSPVAVTLDSSGKIYIADAESYQPAVIRVDDMTGANLTSLFTGANGGLNSIAVDTSGMVFLGAGGVKIVDGMAAVLDSSGTIGPIGPAYVFAVTPVKLPSAASRRHHSVAHHLELLARPRCHEFAERHRRQFRRQPLELHRNFDDRRIQPDQHLPGATRLPDRTARSP